MSPPRQKLELMVRRPGTEAGFEIRHIDPGAALLRFRPSPPADVTVEIAAREEGGFVLNVRGRNTYLQVDDTEHALWLMMDGRRNMQEIATAYFVRSGSLDLSKVARFINAARKAGLIVDASASVVQTPVARVVGWEHRWTDVDAAFQRAARFLSRLAPAGSLPVWGVVAFGGLLAHLMLPRPSASFPYWVWALGFLGAWPMATIPHELAHGVACAWHGRRVNGVGVGLGKVFVDTSDMFMASRAQHAVVAMAGPFASVLCGGAVAITSRAVGGSLGWSLATLADVFFVQAALTAWPFFPQSDGGHALADLLCVPELPAASLRALRAGTLERPHRIWLAGAGCSALALVVAAAGLVWARAT